MLMITNYEYLHCSLESTFHTSKNALQGDFCSKWLIQIIHHSLVIVYTDSSEFPRCNCQMQFIFILAFLQLFSLDYSIFLAFSALPMTYFESQHAIFLSMLLDKTSYSYYPVTQCSQYSRRDCGNGPMVGDSAVQCSQPPWGHQGRTTAARAQGTPWESTVTHHSLN